MTKTPERIAAGAVIRAHRLNRGESQAEFARRLDLTARVVQHAEDGGAPQPRNALALANDLQMKVEELWPLNLPQSGRRARPRRADRR